MLEGRKILWIAGGRDYHDEQVMLNTISNMIVLLGFDALVTGAAKGTDLTAERLWRNYQLPYVGVPAEWDRFRKQGNVKAAGPYRNEVIANEYHPSALLAFPGGAGTANAVRVARDYNIEVFIYPDDFPVI